MPKYLVLYRMHTDWPCSGRDDRLHMQHFQDPDQARSWMDDLFKTFDPECVDIQLYEYTGIQYVLVERRHRDV